MKLMTFLGMKDAFFPEPFPCQKFLTSFCRGTHDMNVIFSKKWHHLPGVKMLQSPSFTTMDRKIASYFFKKGAPFYPLKRGPQGPPGAPFLEKGAPFLKKFESLIFGDTMRAKIRRQWVKNCFFLQLHERIFS